jgi:squalene-hopene/tetraprenyl-beta-curcumene cyclase
MTNNTSLRRIPRSLGVLTAVLAIGGGFSGGRLLAGGNRGWDGPAAARYLDGRATAWFAFPAAGRGRGEDKVSCLSCHTLMPYALGRPALRRIAGERQPSELENRVIAQVRRRVAHWDELDTPRFKLFYDFDDAKKEESRGTESVLNAWILARDDRNRGLPDLSAETRRALGHLWTTQLVEGPEKGSWPWLNFGLGPWESERSRYQGAALAAIAVGTAAVDPGTGDDVKPRARLDLLRGYLRSRFDGQDLHNRIWTLWASTTLDGLLSPAERDRLVSQVLAKQRDDGGWCLATLGDYKRLDGTPQPMMSDGYATGLVLHVLQLAGLGRDHPGVAKGLAWLRGSQQPSGAWLSHSINKQRDPDTNVGKFMSDAATAFAILALDHPGPSRAGQSRD